MKEDVGPSVIRHDKAVTLADVEPFDAAGDFRQVTEAVKRLATTVLDRVLLDKSHQLVVAHHYTRRLPTAVATMRIRDSDVTIH